MESLGPLEEVPCNICNGSDIRVIIEQRHWDAPKDIMKIVRCKSCGLIFTSPRPTVEWTLNDPRHPSHLYEYETKLLSNYLRGIKVIQRKVNKPGAVLFDIGCGGGYFVDLAQKAGYTAKGVDIDPSAVESGRKRGLELYCCELHQLSLDAESVDVITLWDCIEHVRNPIELMREITRILKSDGFVLIQSPNNLLWSILVKSKIKQVDPFEMVAWTHIYHWTPKSLRNILLQSGIRKVTFYPMNSFPAELPILSFASLAHNLKRLIFYLSLRKINIYFPLFALGFK